MNSTSSQQLESLLAAMQRLASDEKAKSSAWFFKTGKGQYGEGDKFLGLTVPEQRALAKKYSSLSLENISKLLKSDIHEHRLTGLLILVGQYRSVKTEQERKSLVDFYLRYRDRVNNWDLVDSSAPYILGNHLLKRPKDILYKLAGSTSVWERRIAVITTYTFIKNNQFNDAIAVSERLLGDTHDLIHKAVGWMLREVGNRSNATLRQFLDNYAGEMPRTMLRYAIEKLPEAERKHYLAVKKR